MKTMTKNRCFNILAEITPIKLPSSFMLKEIIKIPIDSLIMNDIGNPKRTELAHKMASQLEILQGQNIHTVDELQYLITLTANLTIYSYYEELVELIFDNLAAYRLT